jgi:hypothetical protein
MEMIYNFWNIIMLLFGVSIIGWYFVLAIISIYDLTIYLRKNRFDDGAILSSQFSPSVCLIAPAYNEEKNIVDSIKSLLSLKYNNLDLIIVNDGSKDQSLKKMISAFDLEISMEKFVNILTTKKIRGIYRSKNEALKRLIVIDKENGGKSDALNAGLNFSNAEYVACLDVDSIVENDAILKMIKPFLEDSGVIASGGVVRIANACEIEDGRLIDPRFPKSWLPRFQVLEYLRAFLLSRLAWSRFNGLMLISGAFGMFKRDIVVKSGGYNTNTVGEDFEMVVRMRTYMHAKNLRYKVVYIPDPLCWTEAPSDLKILGRQRRRWTRGMMETLKTHKSLFMNPRYKILGMLSFPFWVIFEWFAPIIEVTGFITFIIFLLLNMVDLQLFLLIMMAIYLFAVLNSCLALFAEEISFHKYIRKKDTLIVLLTALLEPIFYHPLNIYWSIRGNLDFLTGASGWGEMTRKGFSKK